MMNGFRGQLQQEASVQTVIHLLPRFSFGPHVDVQHLDAPLTGTACRAGIP